jgi:hypothetical protein
MMGDKIKIDSILGREVIVKGFKITDSKFVKSGNDNKLLTLQIELDNKEYIVFTGSTVLIGQSEEYKKEMPFVAKIEKINNFYTFT